MEISNGKAIHLLPDILQHFLNPSCESCHFDNVFLVLNVLAVPAHEGVGSRGLVEGDGGGCALRSSDGFKRPVPAMCEVDFTVVSEYACQKG